MTNPSSFAVTFDYRCPFARNAHEHVVAALEAGAPWEVEFVPFSLSQVHVEEGGVPAFDDPEQQPANLAPEAAIVVRDGMPDKFRAVHLALFAVRHDAGEDLRDAGVIRTALEKAGVDASAVFAEVESGWPRDAYRKAHESAVSEHGVFGVPTFITGDEAVFVRIMTRPVGDGDLGRRTIERILDLGTGFPELNELKHTRIAR